MDKPPNKKQTDDWIDDSRQVQTPKRMKYIDLIEKGLTNGQTGWFSCKEITHLKRYIWFCKKRKMLLHTLKYF